ATGAVLRTSATAGGSERIPLDGLAAGTYFLQVKGATTSDANSSYTLTIDAPQGIAADWAETRGGFGDNNTRDRATDLGRVAGLQVWDDPGRPLTLQPLGGGVDPSALSEWASSVLGFSSQYSAGYWSAQQALGAPNTMTYGDIASAWAPASPNG